MSIHHVTCYTPVPGHWSDAYASGDGLRPQSDAACARTPPRRHDAAVSLYRRRPGSRRGPRDRIASGATSLRFFRTFDGGAAGGERSTTRCGPKGGHGHSTGRGRSLRGGRRLAEQQQATRNTIDPDSRQALRVRSILVSFYTDGDVLADVYDFMALNSSFAIYWVGAWCIVLVGNEPAASGNMRSLQEMEQEAEVLKLNADHVAVLAVTASLAVYSR